MIVITAATGHLGTLVVEQLLASHPAQAVRVAVRSPEKAAHWAARGVEVVQADYEDPASLERAFTGADKLLLISSSAVGRRVAQHTNAIDAAVRAGVGFIAYTSLLKADTSSSVLADEHRPTEDKLRASGVAYTILRNGWYLENYTENLAAPLQLGAFYGAAGTGRIAAAARADLAAAAVAVLTEDGHGGRTYELGGTAFTMSDLAAAVSDAVGKSLPYVNLPEADYQAALVQGGVPEGFAFVLANADTAIEAGDLDTAPTDLVALIGRPPTALSAAVEAGVRALA
jgi:NAD(P)H dehydrogenase (quinone)